MPTIPRFDPPAFLTDFDAIPGHREGWSTFVSDAFKGAIERVEDQIGQGNCQYYNETTTPSDDPQDLDIIWDGFPKTLIRQFGRNTALAMADGLDDAPVPVPGFQSRIQDEYCEWRVTRDPDTNKIIRVTFTCEGPEYWASLAGGDSIYGVNFGAIGDRDVLLQMYREILGNQDVMMEDLFFPFPNSSFYNPWNKWNTTEGIVHLQQINNTLGAEIVIGADATLLRTKGGNQVTEATQLICCGGFGGVNRSSDPTIGDEVNKLASAGFAITLRNPVGIYFHKFSTEGITKPGPNNTRVPAGNYWKPVRGTFDPNAADPGDMTDKGTMVVRAVYEVPSGELGPAGTQLTVSDLQISGSPITFGGQLAERLTMKFIGRGTRPGSFHNAPIPCVMKCCLEQLPNGRSVLQLSDLNDPCQDVFPAVAPAPMVAVAAAVAPLRIPRSRSPRV
jgi:hypothetical protein